MKKKRETKCLSYQRTFVPGHFTADKIYGRLKATNWMSQFTPKNQAHWSTFIISYHSCMAKIYALALQNCVVNYIYKIEKKFLKMSSFNIHFNLLSRTIFWPGQSRIKSMCKHRCRRKMKNFYDTKNRRGN